MATKPMTKSELLSRIAEETGATKKSVGDIVDSLAEVAYTETRSKGEFTVPGLGKLTLQDRKARTGRNPATGEVINIPAKKVVKFKVSKIANDNIL